METDSHSLEVLHNLRLQKEFSNAMSNCGSLEATATELYQSSLRKYSTLFRKHILLVLGSHQSS